MLNFENYEKALSLLEVQRDGRVYRKERSWKSGNGVVRHHPRQIAKTWKNKKDYLQINVRINGKLYFPYVHVLVALAYIPKPEGWDESWEVNHKNGDKQNNTVSNLEWITHLKNIQHAYRTGLNTKQKPVEQYDLSTGKVIGVYKSQNEAARVVGVNQGNINHCCNGHYKSASGFGWRYLS